MNTEVKKKNMKIYFRVGLKSQYSKTVLPGNQRKGISASQTSISNMVKISILLTNNYFIQQNKGDVVS